MPVETMDKLDIRSILFVGGKGFNIPKLAQGITAHQWEQDSGQKGRRKEEPYPIPDLVIIFNQWCSHWLSEEGRNYAKKYHIPWISTNDSGKSKIVDQFEKQGKKISHIFDVEKPKEIAMSPKKATKRKSAKCRKLQGKFLEDVLAIAEKNGIKYYPIKDVDAEQLATLVNIELNEEIKLPQIKRMMRIHVGTSPKKDTRSRGLTTITPDIPKTDKDAEKELKDVVDKVENEEIKFDNSMPGIFKQILNMHDRIVELIEERNEYYKEVERLTAENKKIGDKLKRLEKLEEAVKNID